MSKLVFASLVGTGLAGDKLALTWEDCGDASTHGHADDVQPTEIVIGQDNTITATGSTDKAISSGSFTAKLTGSLGISETYTGKVCEASEFNLPLGIGTLSWAGMACPVAVGPVTVSLGLKLASAVPSTLATADVALTAVDQDGEPALCVNNHLEREASGTQPTFQEWAAQYGFNGADTTMEAKYNANVEQIEAWNADPEETATYAVNQFSGMTYDEFAAQYLTAKPLSDMDVPILQELAPEEDFVATESDWNVTPVKNQGSCGSCWAFGTLGGIEAVHKQHTGATVNLAEQQLVDCSTQNNGCSGGRPDWAINYLSGKSIYTTASYPYTARDGSCRSGTASGVTVSGYSRVTKSESGLLSALDKSAVTVMVYADSKFQSYSSGVITASTTCSLNHAVLATGYGSNYIKIKNSWGTGWGEAGYIRVGRTTSGCGPFGIWYDYPVVPTGVNAAVEV